MRRATGQWLLEPLAAHRRELLQVTALAPEPLKLGLQPLRQPRVRIPFHRLYLHSLVRTAEGAKMSKTKGTGVDPLQLTEKFGTDAMRYMLASMAAPGTDIILSEDRILGARAFANKIWNAARFLFMNLEKIEAQRHHTGRTGRAGNPRKSSVRNPRRKTASSIAGFSRDSPPFQTKPTTPLQDFRFHEACHRRFTNFSGEISVTGTSSGSSRSLHRPTAQSPSPHGAIFSPHWKQPCACLHPIMPFLTEELWHRLPQPAGARSIALDKFPQPRANWIDDSAEKEFTTLREIITAARNIRAEMKIDQKRKIPADFSSGDSAIRKLAEQNAEPLARLATLSALNISSNRLDDAGAAVRSTSQFDLRIAYGDAIDKDVEVARLRKEIDRLAKDIESKKGRLGDETFLNKAPAKIVEDLKTTLAGREIEHQKLQDRLKQLE